MKSSTILHSIRELLVAGNGDNNDGDDFIEASRFLFRTIGKIALVDKSGDCAGVILYSKDDDTVAFYVLFGEDDRYTVSDIMSKEAAFESATKFDLRTDLDR